MKKELRFLKLNNIENTIVEKLNGIIFYIECECSVCGNEYFYKSSLPYPSNVRCKCTNTKINVHHRFHMTHRKAFRYRKEVSIVYWIELIRNDLRRL